MSFENIIEEKRKSIIQNIEKSISNNIDLDFIEKGGKRAKIGETRIWGGMKYVKHIDGWVVIPKKKDSKPYLVDDRLSRHEKHSSVHEEFGEKHRDANNTPEPKDDNTEIKPIPEVIEKEKTFDIPLSVTDNVLFVSGEPVIIEDEIGGIRIGNRPVLMGRENNRLVNWLKASVQTGKGFVESIINFRDYYKDLSETAPILREKYYNRDINTVNNFLKYISKK